MNSKLVTSLYRKKTFSAVYMSYNTFLPLKHKESLINTLLFQADNIYVDYTTFHNNCVKNFLGKLFVTRKPSNNVSNKKYLYLIGIPG